MPKQPIDLNLFLSEWKQIAEPPVGDGGYQRFLRAMQKRAIIIGTTVSIEFNREQLGDLIFYMMYGWDKGRGGYQGKLRKAFGRVLISRLGIPIPTP